MGALCSSRPVSRLSLIEVACSTLGVSYTLTLTLLPTGAVWLRALEPFGQWSGLPHVLLFARLIIFGVCVILPQMNFVCAVKVKE